jgi:hypothetical protein
VTAAPAAGADALDLLGGLVLDDERTWAEAASAFQLDDAAAICDPTGPRRHFLVRPRGASKTTDAAGVALSLLVTEAPARSRSYAYAVDQDQATELLDAVGGFVARTPGLAGLVELGARGLTVRASGASLSIEASDAASAFNKRPWLGAGRAVELAADREPRSAVVGGHLGATQAPRLPAGGADHGGRADAPGLPDVAPRAGVLGLARSGDPWPVPVVGARGRSRDARGPDRERVPPLRAG